MFNRLSGRQKQSRYSDDVFAPPEMLESRLTLTVEPTAPPLPTAMPVLAVPYEYLADGAFELAVDVFFNARHSIVSGRTPGPVHSHSYRLQVRCATNQVGNHQCVVGIADIKRVVEQATAPFNDQLLNDLPAFQSLQPTSEALVAILYHIISRKLGLSSIRLTSITLWEAPTVSITFTPNRGAG